MPDARGGRTEGLRPEQAAEIEGIIGYSFRDKALLRQCFTLSSASERNNERLEFLGDAVIGFCVAEMLYLRSEEDEGDMTERRKKFVANDVLRAAVERLGLEKYLLHAGGREAVGKKPVASLFEALAAGIYLDGGMPAAKAFIADKLMKPEAKRASGEARSGVNHKGMLQEYLQGAGMPRAEYQLLEKSGPDHRPFFRVRASAQGRSGTGEGGSKAAAEQAAAEKLLESLRNGDKH